MRKLRFALVLPITQVVIALILLLWADRTPVPPHLDYSYHPPAWLICKGLNAPVMLLLVPFGGDWYFVPSRPIVGRGLFLIFVAVVWYLVGRAVDQREAPRPARVRRMVTVLVVRSFVLAAGGLLFYSGWNELSGPITTAVGAFLTLTWSASLIFLSGRALVRMIPRGLAKSG
jgi:hypothetical protein